MSDHNLFIDALPDGALAAHAAFMNNHLEAVQSAAKRLDVDVLAIVLPAAGAEHDDWRRALALDLARAHAPKRVNIIGGGSQDSATQMLSYLRDAPGVTGQYLQSHE